MIIQEMKDQWICSCGNWVGGKLTWCPKCCQDRDFPKVEEKESQDLPIRSLDP